MYTYSIGEVQMGKNTPAAEVANFLSEFTGVSFEDIMGNLRNLKPDGQYIILGEGGAVGYVTMTPKK